MAAAKQRIRIRRAYELLSGEYGPMGWWPIKSKKSGPMGYHPKNFTLPSTPSQVFEVCVGAILTQNTSWKNVEKAVEKIHQLKAMSADGITRLSESELSDAIRCCGYYNQKTIKLRKYAVFHKSLRGKKPSRDALLGVWGVGPETADSILLYAYHVPSFVVDAYTKRIMSRVGVLKGDQDYDDVKKLFEDSLPRNHMVYNEFHALLVEHAKRHCQTKPDCVGCCIKKMCNFKLL